VSGGILGVRDIQQMRFSRAYFTRIVTRLHYKLLLGDFMAWFFGLVALLWFINHLASLFLAFPIPSRWRTSFKVRREARGLVLLHDLHRALSLWFFPVTLVLAMSAVYLNWGTEFRAVVGQFSPISREYDVRAPALTSPLFERVTTCADAIRLAEQHAGGAALVDGVSYNPRKGLYRVRLFDERDMAPTVGRRRVYVSATDGRVQADSHIAAGTAGDRFLAWQFPLHSGKAFGWPNGH